MAETETVNTPVAEEAKMLMPETWEALAVANTFGPGALQKRHDRTVKRIFGALLDDDEQNVLDELLIEYAGKMLAFRLLDPAIDYWSKQITSIGFASAEAKTYADRVKDLKDFRKQWAVDLATLWTEVGELLPDRPQHAPDVPHVGMAGDTITHLTPDPYLLDPPYGPAGTT